MKYEDRKSYRGLKSESKKVRQMFKKESRKRVRKAVKKACNSLDDSKIIICEGYF